ncbi:MAG: tetratricopeptide repeat protein, partial [Gemmataceae bacterium]|nr:tetratricopeptide repeat protein [Gemmataceae bacterium]
IRLEPRQERDHFGRGRILQRNKNYEAAVQAYEKALQIRPSYAEAQRALAECLFDLRRWQEAIQAFDRYLALPEGKPAAAIFRARGLAKAQLRDAAGALEDYLRALESAPEDQQLRSRRGWMYLEEAPRLAALDFQKLIDLNPKNGEAYAGRGYARVLSGRYREAVEDAKEAVRQAPSTRLTLYTATRIYAQAAIRVAPEGQQDVQARELRGRYENEALELLRRCLLATAAAERATFWRERIKPDNALDPLRRRREFQQLEEIYARQAK